MSFFADLLRGVNDRLGVDPSDPDREEKPVDWKMTFSAKPKSNIDMALERKWENSQSQADENSDVTATSVEKNKRTLKINHGDCKTTLTWANDKMAAESCGKVVNEKDTKVDVALGGEIKQKKGEWKVTGKLNALASDLGGAKAGFNCDVEHNNKGETTVKPRLNLEVSDEFNLGVSAKSDTKTLSEIWPQFVYKPKDDGNSFYWVRGDITRKWVMAGCDQVLKDGYNHSFEAVFGYGDFKGFMGQPVALRSGVEYELSDATTTSVSADFGEEYNIQSETSHKLDKNWTVGCTQSFDSSKVAGKWNPYHIGFTASYKL